MKFFAVLISLLVATSYSQITYAQEAEGLQISDAGAVNGRVSLKISNFTQKSGDVVVWIVDGQNQYCERISSIGSMKFIRIEFDCKFITPQSKIRIGYGWSDKVPKTAAIATRLE